MTREMERKLFGDEPGLGKVVSIYYPGKKVLNFEVTGIFKPIPLNSSFNFSALTLIDNFLDGHNLEPGDWTAWQQASIFLRLEDGI